MGTLKNELPKYCSDTSSHYANITITRKPVPPKANRRRARGTTLVISGAILILTGGALKDAKIVEFSGGNVSYGKLSTETAEQSRE